MLILFSILVSPPTTKYKELTSTLLKWILMFDEVSCVIPGASAPEQVLSNLEVLQLSNLSAEEREAVKAVYDRYIRTPVHYKW